MKREEDPSHFTPFPNWLIDEVMPYVRDTEFRILVIIARQTLGWLNPHTGKRKQMDWLTQSQLKRRTGRASEAISHAIEVLVRRGFIEVVDNSGKIFRSAKERRRCTKNLYYRLAPRTPCGQLLRKPNTENRIQQKKPSTK
jgi:hypothetical protein